MEKLLNHLLSITLLNIFFVSDSFDSHCPYLLQAGAMLGDAFLHQLPHAFGIKHIRTCLLFKFLSLLIGFVLYIWGSLE